MTSPGGDGGGGGEATEKQQQPAKTSAASASSQQDARSSKQKRRRPAPGSWSCHAGGCDTLNSARRTECKVCGAPKPGTVLDVGFGGGAPRSRSTREQSTASASDGRRTDGRKSTGRSSDGGDGGSTTEMPSADERQKGTSSTSIRQQQEKSSPAAHPPPLPLPPPHKPTSDDKRSDRKRPAPGSWPCSLCQTLNSARRERCKACNKLKPEDGGGVMLEGFGRAIDRGSMSDSDHDEEDKRKVAHGISSGSNRSKSRSAERRRRHQSRSNGDRIHHHRSRSRSTDRDALSGSNNEDDGHRRHHYHHHGASAFSSKRWKCSACTLLNSDKRTRCKACRTPREGEGDSTSKRQDSVPSSSEHHQQQEHRSERHRRQRLRRSRSKDSVHSSSDQHPSHRKRPHRSRSVDGGDDDLRRQESRRRNAMNVEGQQLSVSSEGDDAKGNKGNDKVANGQRKFAMELFLSSPDADDTSKRKGKIFPKGLLRRAQKTTDEIDVGDAGERTKLIGSDGAPTNEIRSSVDLGSTNIDRHRSTERSRRASDVVTTDTADEDAKRTQKTASRRTKSRSPSPFTKEKKSLSRDESQRKESRSKSGRRADAKSRERSRRSESRGGRQKSSRRRRSHYSRSPSRDRSESREISERRRSHHSRSPSRERYESRKRSKRRRSHHSRSPSRSRSSSPGDRKKSSRRESMRRSKSDGRRLRSSYRRSKSGRRSRHRSRSMSLSSGKRSAEEKAVSTREVSGPSALEIANAVLKKGVESEERIGSFPKSGSKCDLYLLHSKVAESSSAALGGKPSGGRDSLERRASIDHISLVETSKPPTSVKGGTASRRASFGGSTLLSMTDLAGLDTDKRRASLDLTATFKSANMLSGQTVGRSSISIVPPMAPKGENEAEGKVLSIGKASTHASMDAAPSATEPVEKNSSAGKVERRPAPGSWNCPKEECGKLNSARRTECKVCGTSKPKQDTDKRRSKSRRSKSRHRHRSKLTSRTSGKKEQRAPTSSSKEKKSRTKSRKSGDDTESDGGKSDTDYDGLKQTTAAIATLGAAVATTDAATTEGGEASVEKKDVDPKQVAGKDADNSTGTTTTAASSPQSSSKTNDEEDQKELLNNEDGVQMTSQVDRRSVMSRGSRARRSMMALFDSQEEIVLLTPATLESNFVAIIRQKARGPAKYAAFASPLFVVVFVVLLAAFFEFVPVSGVPTWEPVLAIGNQLIESIIETTLYIMAVYLVLKKGSVLAMYFVRHCGLYVGMVCIAYAIGDISLLVQYGSGGANDGGERWARVALSACLGVSSMTTAVLLQGRICTRIELRALNSVTGETDDEIALYLKKDRHLTPDEMRKKREGIKDWYHRTMYIAVLGYQVLAVMIPLASSVWYLINDVGSLTEINLCRYTTSRCVDITIRPNALVDKNVEIKWNLQNGALILSILESIGAFSHDAFVLATFSKAALFPHKPGSVGIAAFAAFGKLSLAIGYLINLLLLWTSDSLAEGLVWSMCFAFLDIACASLVLVACFRYTPTLRRAWRSTLSDNEVDELSDSSHKRLGCKTLRSIAFSAQQLLNPKKKKWAKALFISTLSVFLLDSLQGILVLIETTNQYGNTYIAETFKFSMHICLFYAFVNFFSVSDRGKHFYKSRRAMGAIAICGVLIRSWQMAQMVVQSEKLADVKPATGKDIFVQSILAIDVLANLGLLLSAFAISDLDLSQKSTRRLSNAEYSPVAVENGDGNADGDAKVDSRTQLLLAKMVEGDLRQRARNVFCLYLISVWVYSMSLAIFDGLNSGTAPYLPATFDHILDNMLAASVALTDAMNQQEMTTRRSLYAITPRLRPFVFVLALSRPGLEIFFHYGLVFSIFCFDGLRKKPRKRYSLVTAGTFAFHAFALLLVFLIAMTYSSVTSSNAIADFNNVGDDDDAVTDDGNISALLGVASSFVRETQEDDSAAEIVPFLCLVIWFIFLIPMAVTLHMLWKGRRRIHNIVSGGEAPKNTNRRKPGDSVDVDLEAAIAADIETRALLAQPAVAGDNDKEGGGTSHSTRKRAANRKESSEARSSKKKEETSRSRKSKRSSTKKQRPNVGEDAESSKKKSGKASETSKPSRTSRKGGRRRSSALEANSDDEDRHRGGDMKSRSSKKKDRRRSSTMKTDSKNGSKSKKSDRHRSSTNGVESDAGGKSVGKADSESKAPKEAAGKVDSRRSKSSSRKPRGSSRSKSRGQSTKRKQSKSTRRDASVHVQSKASKDESEAIDDSAHASNTQAKDVPPDTKQQEKPQSLVETEQQEEPQKVPKETEDNKNEEVSNEKQATIDATEEAKTNKESSPPTEGELV